MTEKKKRVSLFRFILLVLIVFLIAYFVMGIFSRSNTVDNSTNNVVDNNTTEAGDKDIFTSYYTGT